MGNNHIYYSFNKGNVAEILFAGAIFLRFKSKATRIDSNQIKRLIESLPAKSNTGRVSVLSDNLDPDSNTVLKKPKDAIHFIYGLAMNNYLAVKDMTLWSAWSKILQG